jgi:hypothetical protein
MRLTWICVLLVLSAYVAVPAGAQARSGSDFAMAQPPPERPAAPPAHPPTPPSAGGEPGNPPRPRPPLPPEAAPAPGGPGMEADGPRPPHPPQPWGPLMRILRERRPELAERLERLRRDDPERFERVLMDAFVLRLEGALEEASGPHQPSAGPPPPSRPGELLPPEPERDRPLAEAREKQGQLEARSRELAEKLRRAQAEGRAAEELDGLRRELRSVVEEQFAVRSRLREGEIQHIERELQRLRERVAQLHRELEQRERERESIIEHHMQQLFGDEGGGW